MNKCLLGIDLGTSSVKVLARYFDGKIVKASAGYEEISVPGWLNAMTKALRQIDCGEAIAVGLSSQVGTYIVRSRIQDNCQSAQQDFCENIISWNDAAGEAELKRLKEKYSREEFIAHIAMPHPDIISYPLPRLLYIKEHYPKAQSVCQPKDRLIQFLTGKLVTDQYSWRGLADPEKAAYSSFFLRETGVEETMLPPVKRPQELAGYIVKEAAQLTGLPVGIPVYTGMNDFFASLAGMGIADRTAIFDITGTSEHVGVLTETLNADTSMVSGKYLQGFVHYGVTASSGVSLKFGCRDLGSAERPVGEMLKRNPPVFTPYLNGERAPIFDSSATGTFFGIGADCTREDLAYAVMEGVVFSLYHIYESLGMPDAKCMIVSGGAAGNPYLNQLKADVFGREVVTLKEKDTSALGAVMAAAIGEGIFRDYGEAARKCCETDACYLPDIGLREILMKRYGIYKQLYPALKNQSKEFRSL